MYWPVALGHRLTAVDCARAKNMSLIFSGTQPGQWKVPGPGPFFNFKLRDLSSDFFNSLSKVGPRHFGVHAHVWKMMPRTPRQAGWSCAQQQFPVPSGPGLPRGPVSAINNKPFQCSNSPLRKTSENCWCAGTWISWGIPVSNPS